MGKAKNISGRIELPGDKSISHRAAMLLAMAEGQASVSNFASSADCAATVRCLQGLGVDILRDGNSLAIRGAGKRGFRKPNAALDCENSGTTMRLLAGVLAGQAFDSELIGDASLQSRPMRRIIDPLTSMGAEIHGVDDKAPLKISGSGRLKAITYEPKAASAQLKSCVLLAGLNADGVTSVLERTPTRDHTERMLRWLGVDVNAEDPGDGTRLSVSGQAVLKARDIMVPADLSSAAFFIVAAAFLEGSVISMPNVGINPSRRGIIDVLQGFGIDIEIVDERNVCNEPVGTLIIRGSDGNKADDIPNLLSGAVIANLIDEIPILAVAGTQLAGGLEIRGASELRIKETDRIAAVVKNLRAMNANIEEFEDGFRVERSVLNGAEVDSFGDHRIAMAFGIAGLFADGETRINGAECAAVSFPEFFDVLSKAVVR